MLFGTVGVAPGTFTLNVPGGGSAHLLGPNSVYGDDCRDDINGPYGYGQPARGWYDRASCWYDAQFLAPVPGCSTSGGATMSQGDVLLDPYGTDSHLKGVSLADAMTIAGMRVDILGLAAAAVLGIGFTIHHFAKPRARRRRR